MGTSSRRGRNLCLAHCVEQRRGNEADLVNLQHTTRSTHENTSGTILVLTNDGPLVAMDWIGMLEKEQRQ